MPDEPIPPAPPKPKKKSWWKKIITKIADAAEDFMEWAGDEEVAALIRDDLGIDTSKPVPNPNLPMTEVRRLREYAEGTDVTAEAFAATVEQATTVIEAMVAFVQNFGDNLDEDEAWDFFHKVFAAFETENLRASYPAVYWMAKSMGLFHEQFGNVEGFDLDAMASLFNPDDDSGEGFDEFEATRVSDITTFVIQQIFGNLIYKFGPNREETDAGPTWLDSYYGWDTPPEHRHRTDVNVLERMWTVRFAPDLPGSPSISVTFAAVPTEHGGPGLFMSFGGGLAYTQEVDEDVLTIGADLNSGLGIFWSLGGSADSAIDGNPDPGVVLDVSYRPKPVTDPGEAEPSFEIGEPGSKVHVKVQQIGFKADLVLDDLTAGAQLNLIDSQIAVKKDAHPLLDKLLRDDLELDFEVGVRWDQANGLHLTNGSAFHTLVPLNRAIPGITVHFVELAVHPKNNTPHTLEFQGTTSVTIELGIFKAQIERFGFVESVDWSENRGYHSDFQPPKGVALSLKGDKLKGGGYLFIDPDNNQYSGVLELRYGKISVKAIGMLTTEVPGFPGDWAFFALVTAEGFKFGPIVGLGGLIGVHHGLSIDNLQDGIRTGVLDSILFPKDPTANPAQVINHIRAVFPITPGAVTLGLMAKLEFGVAVKVMLGLIVQVDNAIGEGSWSINRVSVIGRLQIEVPKKVKITLDIAGSYDSSAKFMAVDGRLRDSKIGKFTITGSGLVRDQGYRAASPGLPAQSPSRIATIGGWHPRFTDLPDGLPKQDRFGFSIKSKKGAKTKYEVSVKAYYATTPNTTQIGLTAKASGSRSGFKFSGTFGFDGIWYENPDYFELDVKFGASIKKGSTNLLTIDFDLYIRGSGHWIVKGKGKIKILWWDIPLSISREWGSELPAVTELIMVEDELAAAIRDRRNWMAELPDQSEMLVSLREQPSGDTGSVFAHPLGRLSFTQQVVPLGVEIDRLGPYEPEGDNRFDITEVKIGDDAEQTTDLTSFFSLQEFLDLEPEERLTMPSFERLNAGVAVDVVEHGIPVINDIVSAEPDYELKYWRQATPPTAVAVGYEQVQAGATIGSAARSDIGRNRFETAGPRPKVVVEKPKVVIATKDSMQAVDDVESSTYVEARQRLDHPDHQLIERHELEAV